MKGGHRGDGTYWLVVNGVELHRIKTVLKHADISGYPDAFVVKISEYARKLERLLEQREEFSS